MVLIAEHRQMIKFIVWECNIKFIMVEQAILIIAFLVGLGIGSFINVITIRFQPDEKVGFTKLVSGRSRCPFCLHQLSWYDLIPVFSFIFLRGKCRYCKKNISWQYPIVELLTALIFSGIVYRFLNLDWIRLSIAAYAVPFWVWITIIIFLFYAAILIIMSIIDIRHYVIPDNFIVGGIIVALLSDLFFYFISLKNSIFPSCGLNFLGGYLNYFNCQMNFLVSYLLGAIVIGGFLFLIYALTKGKGMGFGDVKLGVLLGLMLGLTNGILALILSFIIGSIFAIILLIFKKKNLKAQVPFGPFLSLGFFIVIFFGSGIVESYLSLF